MTKQILFLIGIILSVSLIIVLLLFKFNSNQSKPVEIHEQETSSNQLIDKNNSKDNTDEKSLIKLSSDETYISSFTTDLNEDGLLDEIVAVKKMLQPSIYIILALQNPDEKTYKKVLEIKTTVLVPSSLDVYSIQLLHSLPLIVCSGLGLNNEQSMSLYLVKQSNNENIICDNIASLNASIQVQIQDHRTSTIGSLDDYSFHAYDFETKDNTTLNQIHSEYKWIATANKFIKINEEKIQGNKIENPILKELRTGSLEAYKNYLGGVWYMPTTIGDNLRYLYYDKYNNRFIFHIGNIEEIYVIQNMFARRFGFSIIANNSSISSIKRRIEIDVKNIDEIQLKVIENIASLKITTSSNWDGLYRKKKNIFTQAQVEESLPYLEMKSIFSNSSITWINAEGFLRTSGSSYILKYDGKEEKGLFNLMMFNNKNIMQTKSETNKKSFYIIEIIKEQNKEENSEELSIKLTPINFMFSKIELKNEEAYIFKELKE
ncbi:MAG: pallilysin-related adhesin [Treponema sp.]